VNIVSIIGHCHEILAEILERPSRPADQTISRFFRDRRYLGSRDRGAIAEIVYDALRLTLRNRFLLRIDPGTIDPEREAAIHLIASLHGKGYADEDLSAGTRTGRRRTGEIVEATRLGESRIAELEEPLRSAVEFSMPQWFAAELIEQVGPEEGRRMLESLNDQAPIVLRANRLVTDRDRLIEALSRRDIASARGVYSPDAVILERRMNANAIPEFKQGWFELQDEGSQMLSILLDPHPNWRVFDACAGAGGKSLHLAAIMKGRGEVAAHDVNARRLAEIRPRLRRSGAQNVRVIDHDAYRSRIDTLRSSFDAVLVDAPCSGSGVLRRNPGARLTLDVAMVERVVRLQREILDEYAALVKPGGILMYATCSLLRRENESQVERFLETREGWEIEAVSTHEDLVTPEGFYRSYPHRPRASAPDGFFGALLRRR